MKKIKFALSIAVLLGTLTVVGVSRPQSVVNDSSIPDCNCRIHNPEGIGVYDANHQCQQVTCQEDMKLE